MHKNTQIASHRAGEETRALTGIPAILQIADHFPRVRRLVGKAFKHGLPPLAGARVPRVCNKYDFIGYCPAKQSLRRGLEQVRRFS